MQCSVDGCQREAHYKALQLCQKHYFRQWRYGTTELTRSAQARFITPAGYHWIYEPNHPLRHSKGKYVAEHRAALYSKLGDRPFCCELCQKPLTWKTCHVDHIDNNPGNNKLENLRPTCSRCNTWRSMPAPAEWNRTHVLEFEGVKLTPAEWARDPRVKICGHQIVARKKAGMTDEQALFSPKVTHNGKKQTRKRPYKPFEYYEFDGVKMTVNELSRLPGATVSAITIRKRIRQGLPLRQAIFLPAGDTAAQGRAKTKALKAKL